MKSSFPRHILFLPMEEQSPEAVPVAADETHTPDGSGSTHSAVLPGTRRLPFDACILSIVVSYTDSFVAAHHVAAECAVVESVRHALLCRALHALVKLRVAADYGLGDAFWSALAESHAEITGGFLVSVAVGERWDGADMDIVSPAPPGAVGRSSLSNLLFSLRNRSDRDEISSVSFACRGYPHLKSAGIDRVDEYFFPVDPAASREPLLKRPSVQLVTLSGLFAHEASTVQRWLATSVDYCFLANCANAERVHVSSPSELVARRSVRRMPVALSAEVDREYARADHPRWLDASRTERWSPYSGSVMLRFLKWTGRGFRIDTFCLPSRVEFALEMAPDRSVREPGESASSLRPPQLTRLESAGVRVVLMAGCPDGSMRPLPDWYDHPVERLSLQRTLYPRRAPRAGRWVGDNGPG